MFLYGRDADQSAKSPSEYSKRFLDNMDEIFEKYHSTGIETERDTF